MKVRSRKLLRVLLIAFIAFIFGVPICVCDTPSGNKTQKEIDQIRKLAEKGHIEQQIELAAAYVTGHGVPVNLVQAAHWYQKAAEAGDPDAENQIGYFCQHGIGVQVDPVRAFHWYQLASAAGSIQAKVNMGVSYLSGMGISANPSTARQLFLEAAQKGSGLSAAYLGDMYLLGIGGPRNLAEAENWFTRGVRMRDPVAAFGLASLLSEVPDHDHDFRRAAELLQLAATKGYVPAIHQLGLLLVNHPELADSPQEPVSLLQEASLAGSWKSSVLLGVLARDGSFTPPDLAEASYYFHLASLQGGEKARQILANDLASLARTLPPGEEAARSSQAAAWFQQHSVPLLFVVHENEQQRAFPLAAIDSSIPIQSGQ